MLDKVFAAIGMLGVIAFMGVVTVFVMEPDLWIVTIVVIGIGITYFVTSSGPASATSKATTTATPRAVFC